MKQVSYILLAGLSVLSCSSPEEQQAEALHKAVSIVPDYREVTMPCNIAPPTFTVCDSMMLDDLQAVFRVGEKSVFVAHDGENGFCIDMEDWNMLKAAGKLISITVQGKQNGKWLEYDSFNIHISKDSIDGNLTYRLIEPGYEVWNEMGIYRRSIADYAEKAVITNKETNGGCVNCHSFCNYNQEKMLFHLRVDYNGTYVVDDDDKSHTKGAEFDGALSKRVRKLVSEKSLVYPMWHPSGRYIAFSQNQTKQMFHTTDRNRIEVFDLASDVVVYDLENDDILTCPRLHASDKFETFPAWSPDGRSLYFCSADSVEVPKDYDKVHYSLCKIDFNPESCTFGEVVDTLYNARKEGGSVSFPRISPDGKYLLLTHHGYGNFSIWHKDADIWMMDLSADDDVKASDEATKVLNSVDVDSYHSWSSNGRWVVFSSRRDDGLYTRPYIAHFDGKGHFSKPFVLPQSSASYYKKLMKSYNIPEFTRVIK